MAVAGWARTRLAKESLLVETSIEGLWYIQAADDAKARFPLLAKVGEDTHLLAFSSAFKARAFIQRMDVPQADIGLIVRGNLDEVRTQLRTFGTAGIIVDYDPATKAYAAARAA